MALGFAAAAVAACGGPAVTEVEGGPDPDFDIEIRYWPGTALDGYARLRIEAAAVRWERILTAGLPDVRIRGDAGCGPGSPALDETVDDLVVYVRVVELDALAESGPCLVRPGSGLPLTGTIWLDGPDRVGQLNRAVLEALATHELAHVLGFGSLWPARGLLRDPSLAGGRDPHYVGEQALTLFDEVGGGGYPGAKIPVDDSRTPGTADVHWRQSPFGQELMTPAIFFGDNPLSVVTTGAIADLGYDVEVGAADLFTLPVSLGRALRVPAVAPGPPGTVALEITERAPRWPILRADTREVVVPAGRSFSRPGSRAP